MTFRESTPLKRKREVPGKSPRGFFTRGVARALSWPSLATANGSLTACFEHSHEYIYISISISISAGEASRTPCGLVAFPARAQTPGVRRARRRIEKKRRRLRACAASSQRTARRHQRCVAEPLTSGGTHHAKRPACVLNGMLKAHSASFLSLNGMLNDPPVALALSKRNRRIFADLLSLTLGPERHTPRASHTHARARTHTKGLTREREVRCVRWRVVLFRRNEPARGGARGESRSPTTRTSS